MAWGQTEQKAGRWENWKQSVRPLISTGKIFLGVLNWTNQLRQSGETLKAQTLFPIHGFDVEPPPYSGEWKKYVNKMEIEQNVCLFIANESYKVTALKY